MTTISTFYVDFSSQESITIASYVSLSYKLLLAR
jgi:hypothetical protein